MKCVHFKHQTYPCLFNHILKGQKTEKKSTFTFVLLENYQGAAMMFTFIILKHFMFSIFIFLKTCEECVWMGGGGTGGVSISLFGIERI